MTTKELFIQIKKHYWACDNCHKKAGGEFPKGHVCTKTLGECKVCGAENVTLTPWVDFFWPKESDYLNVVASINRD